MAYPKGRPRKPTNLGIPHSKKTRRRISESCKKAGMGKWNIGRKQSKEHIEKIRQRLIGLGKSAEHCQKITEGLKKYYQTHLGLERRRIISKFMKKRWRNTV